MDFNQYRLDHPGQMDTKANQMWVINNGKDLVGQERDNGGGDRGNERGQRHGCGHGN